MHRQQWMYDMQKVLLVLTLFHGLQESCFCDRRDRMETNFGIYFSSILNARHTVASDFDVSFKRRRSLPWDRILMQIH